MSTMIRARRRRASMATMALAVLAGLGAGTGPVAAHGPDPYFSGSLWAMDQPVTYAWKSSQLPPAWMQSPIHLAASDVNRTRSSRAATFSYSTAARSLIAYGEPTGCSSAGIACFSRANAPTSFAMWFRAQGYAFDWGRLKWCQYYSSWPDRCFDVENIALDEFGHVEILNHHATYSDERDYVDAIVQTVAHAKPKTAWNAHAFGRCDVATLQRKYDVQSWTQLYSTCLDLATTLGLGASATSVTKGASVTFTATLKVATKSTYERMSANPISGRIVTIQRRTPGASSWSTVGTMTSGSTAGTYVYTASASATYEWRASFSRPASEGLRASTSAGITVTVK